MINDVSSDEKEINNIFWDVPVIKQKNGYPYSNFSITDFNIPVHPQLFENIANLIVKKISSDVIDKIDIVVSEGDRGGGPIAQEVSKKLNKPFVLSTWHIEANSPNRVKTKVGFSGEWVIQLTGIKKGDKVLIVDDLISSGGTLDAMISIIKFAEAEIIDVICVGEKVDQQGRKRIKDDYGIDVKTLVKFSAEEEKTKIIIDKITKKNNFWESEKALNYKLFNIELPSEIVAYKMTYKFADVKNKIVLDYGCFNGNSSSTILNLGAKEVVGVDSSLKSVNDAKRNKDYKNLKFLHVPKDQEIKITKKFDVCTFTFVHPVINNKKELKYAFEKINKVLKNKGTLITLWLNPKAFDEKYDFKYYDFNKKQNNTNLNDGEYFENNLYLPDKSILKLKDVFWSQKTLCHLIEKSWFKIESTIDLGTHKILNKHKNFFMELERKIAKQFNITWLDEWTAPLYQIIIAKKDKA